MPPSAEARMTYTGRTDPARLHDSMCDTFVSAGHHGSCPNRRSGVVELVIRRDGVELARLSAFIKPVTITVEYERHQPGTNRRGDHNADRERDVAARAHRRTVEFVPDPDAVDHRADDEGSEDPGKNNHVNV